MSFMKFCNSARAAVHRSPQRAFILASRVMTFIARHNEQTLLASRVLFGVGSPQRVEALASRARLFQIF